MCRATAPRPIFSSLDIRLFAQPPDFHNPLHSNGSGVKFHMRINNGVRYLGCSPVIDISSSIIFIVEG